jgi:hypothetical protein
MSVLYNSAILNTMNAHDALELARVIQMVEFEDAQLEVKRA